MRLRDDAAFFGPDLVGPLTGIAVDSRDVKPGFLFAALPGSKIHGAEFATYALRMGAVAVLTDAEGMRYLMDEGLDTAAPVIVAKDARLSLARAASVWYGAQPETIVAVTGTNGKTSVATFLRQIWQGLGRRAVNFGTTGVEGSITRPLSHTTPEPVTLHALLADLAGNGVTHAAMEASSHGLDQRRLDGVRLAAGGFTHLSRDHLDYHETMEAYAEAKLGLFSRVLPEDATAVVNIDDPIAAKAGVVAQDRGLGVISTGRNPAAMLALTGTEFHDKGQVIHFTYRGVTHSADLALIGGFQAENALLAAGLAIGAGEDAEEVFAQLEGLGGVRGRMELAATRQNGAPVYVDYSHTPDSVATALKALRPHVAGRLIVVVGAGGDRDPGKRPMMGKAAVEGADIAIITDDNPRTEDPALIRAAVMAGAPGATEVGDRAEAILRGVDMLGPEDALLIAGKGHETGQIVGSEILPFDDAEQARAAVTALDRGGL
ncbi:UDP-N-acetylmuramoyl-L-alanyl-D-glutamate--2,6-diaminopimelate ligase [Rubricella aquisinus]|uniref:UDP-N-acetylmuramoyl-L-alanyl-D-glutamate--2,6-diaminopimelate ligase n=1 Tax=Rubricella aquisinus TaxID=2028108 RepID=A0A840WJS4_9RHOB|nr:UDP-N-acetylmuramoyl-L-alanyl-D-glutamate--2,6-diaminopimelate ligase [Rubricella aquisinus]MBB5515348.1 UDP-N-acetylmuramoyl-L-alanyl-D-glutamate--2,6-diaminopimelate ligase [Rubricella aquisinus]